VDVTPVGRGPASIAPALAQCTLMHAVGHPRECLASALDSVVAKPRPDSGLSRWARPDHARLLVTTGRC
jgi:hypothetical protein